VPESATIRSAKHTPRLAPAYAAALRRVAASWLASAPAARNTAALDTTASEKKSSVPAAMCTFEERPTTTVLAAVMTQKTAKPTPSPAIACALPLRRVVWPASRSSQRPESSSPRESRVPASSPHTAPRMLSTPAHFQAV
jgi:hypothetical protein